jgi:ligand-binding sensor domain-containing protein
MVDDGLGYYWMGTDRGIIRVAREDLHQVQQKLASSATFTLLTTTTAWAGAIAPMAISPRL